MSLVMNNSPSRRDKNLSNSHVDELDKNDDDEDHRGNITPRTATNQNLDRSALNQSIRRLGLSADAIDLEYIEKFGMEQFNLGQEKVK